MAQSAGHTIYSGTSAPDGAGAGGWAAIVVAGDRREERSGVEWDTTNDRLELHAVLAGLAALPAPGAVELVTRNQKLAQALGGQLAAWQANGWRAATGRPLKHAALWQELAAALEARPVRCVISRARSEPGLSEQAQQLAVRAARSARAT